MFQKSLIFGVFVAVAMLLPLNAYAGRGAASNQKLPSLVCSQYTDIHSRVNNTDIFLDSCVPCTCLGEDGSTQIGYIVKFRWGVFFTPHFSGDCDEDCDDFDCDFKDAFVSVTRFCRETETAGQVKCTKCKEDISVQFFDEGGVSYSGTGVGVSGIGSELENQLCCNAEFNQAVIHVKGNSRRHDTKKCWARLKYISKINQLGPTPCDLPDTGSFEWNGIKGCLCKVQHLGNNGF